MTTTDIVSDLKFGNRATVSKWSRKCRETAVQMCFAHSEPIGGPGKIVEIDESKFGKSIFISTFPCNIICY